MHAVVVRVKVNDYSSAQQHLRERVVPGVQQAPGFRNGVWLAPEGGTNGEGLSIVTFDTEDNARQAADTVRPNVPPEVEVLSVDVREVAASA
jgi:hypothetical protein